MNSYVADLSRTFYGRRMKKQRDIPSVEPRDGAVDKGEVVR
jgi:hypothetical protein